MKLVWVFAPLAVALLYGAGHALLAPAPTVDNLAPEGTILVQRFRSLEVFDAMQPAGRKAPSQGLGESLNIPGLAGVDRNGPIHMMQLPRKGIGIRSLVVLRVDDSDALDARFHDVDLIDKGFIRRAQHLRLYDGWAAFSPDRDLTRRLGEGGITLPNRGEDFGIAARVPELIDHALSLPNTAPWNELLAGMGVRLAGAAVNGDGSPRGAFEGLGHIQRLRAGWQTAHMWTWASREGAPRVEVTLESSDSPVRAILARVHGDVPINTPIAVPTGADAWLRVPDARARSALALAAYSLGVSFRQNASADADAVPTAVTTLAKVEGLGGVAVWIRKSLREKDTWDYSAVGAQGALPDPQAWMPGTDWITRYVNGYAVASSGSDAKRVLDQYTATLAMDTSRGSRVSLPEGERLLASFYLSLERARTWLGGLVRKGGLWAMLDEHNLHGTVSTDGTRLHLRITGVK